MRNPLHSNQRPPRCSPLAALRASVAGAFVLALSLLAVGGDEAMFGGSGSGGDSIGSLPLTAPGGGQSDGSIGEAGAPGLIGPARPSIALTGREADLLAVLLNATPISADANYDVFELADGRLRLEFYGQLSLLLDRERLMTLPVIAQLRIGSTFQGGAATLSVAGEARGVQALPLGYLPLPLQQLSGAGVLPLGLEWRAQSLGGLVREIDVHQTGSVIHVVQHD